MNKFLIFSGVILFFSSCHKTTTDQLPTPASAVMGRVALYDSTNKTQPNCKGVTVSIDGTSYTTTTDSTGKYAFENVPQTKYTFTYSKAGYSTHKDYAIDLTGSKTVQAENVTGLYMPCSTNVSLAASLSNSLIEVQTTLTSNPSIFNPWAVVFFSDSASVSSSNYTIAYYISPIPATQSAGGGLTATFKPSPYFASGSTVYIKVYATNTGNSYYATTAGGTIIYEGLGSSSNVVSVTLP